MKILENIYPTIYILFIEVISSKFVNSYFPLTLFYENIFTITSKYIQLLHEKGVS